MELVNAVRLLGLPSKLDLPKPTAPTYTKTDQAATTITGGVMVSRGSGKFRYTGPAVGNWPAQSSFYVPGGTGTLQVSAMLNVDFMTDAQYVEIYTLRYNTKLDIRVNGFITNSVSLDSAGSATLLKLDFGADSVGVVKHIELAGFNFPFGGVFTEASGSVWYPSLDKRPLIYFFGDSYTQGTGAAGPDQVYAKVIANQLGMRSYQDGIGGTGWASSDAANLVTERFNRRLDKMGEAPDFVVAALGYNDSGANVDTVKNNLDAWVKLVQAKYPDAKIVVLGPWTPLGATAALDTIEDAIKAKCTELNLSFVSAKDVLNAKNKGIYNSGDNVHPNQNGHNFLGYRMAALTLEELIK